MSNELDCLSKPVREAVATVDFYFNDGAKGTGWPTIRAELLRLARENLRLVGGTAEMPEWIVRLQARARDADRAEAERDALRARIASAPVQVLPVPPDAHGVVGKRFAMVKLQEGE